MQLSTLVLDAIVRIDTAQDEHKAVEVFSEFIKAYEFESIALGYLVSPSSMPKDRNFQITTWPLEWYEHWRGKDLIIHDPIARYALKTRKRFSWKTAYDHATRFGQKILDESRNFGLVDGIASPIPSPDGPPGCVSLGGGKIDLSPVELGAIELVAIHAYSRLESLCGLHQLSSMQPLSKREIDVLQYAAGGKSNWEIGSILSISEKTASEYMRSAMRKLDCANRAQAVAVAIRHSYILP